MPTQGHGDHQLKRIVLPSGKTIEVVYFDHPAAAPPAKPEAPVQRQQKTQAPAPQRDLHICPDCHSTLVYPVHWEEADNSHWSITLRCPNCEWFEVDIFEQTNCDRFDDELERGSDALTRDYKRLMAANLAEEIDRFVHALNAGGIFPMDF